jgi:transposase
MAYACHACGNHIFPLAGTIFHKSTTSLKTWFYVIKLMSSTRVGISAKQIQRETGVTYKTAWRMMKQVRQLMDEQIKLKGSRKNNAGLIISPPTALPPTSTG